MSKKLTVVSRGKPIKALSPNQKKQTRKLVKQLISSNTEHKIVDNYALYFYLNRSATVYRMSYNTAASAEIIQGTGQSQRIGNRIKFSSMELRYNLYYDASSITTNPQHTARIMVFRWNDDISLATPTVADILQYNTSGPGNYPDITSPYDYGQHQGKQFTVLYDKVHNLGASSQGVFKLKRKALNSELTWINGVSVSGSGHIYILAVADDVTGGTAPQLYLQYHCRLRYVDA